MIACTEPGNDYKHELQLRKRVNRIRSVDFKFSLSKFLRIRLRNILFELLRIRLRNRVHVKARRASNEESFRRDPLNRFRLDHLPPDQTLRQVGPTTNHEQ